MNPNHPVSFRSVTRRFGNVDALRDVTFDVAAGRVTALLGPNGAGKTTLLRILLGLDRPDTGVALVAGQPFAQLEHPSRTVGSLIDGAGFHPGRSAAAHLSALADLAGIDRRRVRDVVAQVDLVEAGDRRVGGFSLGMRQRLGLASALLADPSILVLDEPANGLDPAGMRWLRSLLREFTDNGGTVLVSSHVLDEIEHVADDVVVLVGGVVRRHAPLASFTTGTTVVVRSPHLDRLLVAVADDDAVPEFEVTRRDGDGAELAGVDAETIGRIAATNGLVLHELRTQRQRLEEIFLAMTGAESETPS